MKQLKLPQSFTIDFNRWLHGEGSRQSRMYRPSDRKMCCLGFLAQASGCKIEEITNIDSPQELYFSKHIEILGLLTGKTQRNNHHITKLMQINDDPNMLDLDERLDKLTWEFDKLGIKVEFTNVP